MSEPETRGPEFGEREIKTVKYGQIEVLPQIRKKMDEEKLADLAASIEFDPVSGEANLINPIIVNVLDEEHYGAYVRENAEFFGRDIGEVSGLHIPGVHYVVIAGHRRRVAVGMRAEFEGLDPSDVTVPVSVRHNMSFQEAFKLQLRENNHDRPATQDEAGEVAKYVEARRREDPNVPLSQCARELGWTSDRLRAACKYNELPGTVRERVEERVITFTNAVDLWNLLAAYRLRGQHHVKKGTFPEGFENIEEYAAYELVTKMDVLISKRLIGVRSQLETKKIIDGWVNTVKPAEFEQGEFELLLDDTPEVRRNTSRRELAKTAVKVLQYIGYSDLTDETRRELASLLGVTLPEAADLSEQMQIGDIA